MTRVPKNSEQNESTAPLDVSPAKSFYLGLLFDELLFPFPKYNTAEEETLRIVLDSVDKFLEPKHDEFRRYDVEGAQPDEYLESLKELGLFGLIIPEEYGGIGFSNAAYARVLQQSSRYDASTSLTVGAHSSIGMKGVLLFGNEQQKKAYLPRLASGELIAAFCLTEAGSGSDAASIKTKAEQNPDGSWTLNGEKIWITNGATAGLFTVFARTDSEAGKLSAFIVERQWDGISTGPKEDKMGIRASATTTVSFNNVRIPQENLLGEVGKGFKIAMEILNNGRTGLGGGCVGGMKRCIDLAVAQATNRKQFGKSIAEFGLIKEKIAQMTVACFATESVVRMVAGLIDSGRTDYSVEAAISKIYATESLWSVVNEALQIAGGNGFMREYPYERVVRDSRINMIFEGTNEILRLYVALSGLKEAGDYLKDLSSSVGKILNDPIKGFGVLSGYATKKFSQYTSLGRQELQRCHPELKDLGVVYEQYALALSREAEVLLRRHGKAVIEEQFAMKRLAEVTVDLFVGLSVLSRVSSLIEQKGIDACQQERAIAEVFTNQAKRRMNQNLRRIEKNEDELLISLADAVVADGRYRWDTF